METKPTVPYGAGGVYSAQISANANRKTNNYSVRFWLRPTEASTVTPDTVRSLQVGIRINCQQTIVLPVVELSSGNYERIVIKTKQWDQEGQRATGNPKAGSAVLAYSRRVREIYDRQLQYCKNLRISLLPNSLSVAYEARYGVQPVVVRGEWIYAKREKPLWSNKPGRAVAPTPQRPVEPIDDSSILSAAFAQYITMLRERTGALALSPITLGRWERGLLLVDTFVMHTGQPCPLAAKVTVGWARRFHAWIQSDSPTEYKLRPLEPLQANRLLCKVREVLQWVYEEGLADKNPLLGVKWGRAIRRYNVQYLEADQVEQLAHAELDDSTSVVRWWFLLMCYTGMDYPDAMSYAHDRKGYEQLGRAGWKIVGKRKKPPHNIFYVPLLPEVLQLFEQYPEGPYEYCLNTINQHTPKFEQLLGVDWRITAKTARKTFGNMMLNRGYRIADVSKMLGHSTIAMTERHYVRVGETHIDNAMLRVEGAPSAAQAIVYLEAA